MLLLSILFFILGAALDAAQDVLKSNFSTSKFKNLNPKFWNPAESWVNKWANGSTTKERFPGSSTIFSAFTDAWHLLKFAMLLCLFSAIALWPLTNFIISLIILTVLWGIFFELFYRFLHK